MPPTTTPPLTVSDIAAARRRLASGVRRTPCQRVPAISAVAGFDVWLKREDLQRTGSFKERGARNALLCLSPAESARGVVAASAGNHALGLAYHGAQLGIRVTVVVPRTAPAVKVTRCRSLGAEVVTHGLTFEEAQVHAVMLAAATGASLIHPFDDPRVIAGQGTMAFELLEQAPAVDTLVVPVGGGGLLAGLATVVKAMRPDVRIVAVEPVEAAGFVAAWLHGSPVAVPVGATLADGLAVARMGGTTFAAAVTRVDDLVTVDEDEIAGAIALLARHGIVAEGAGAVGVAAVLAGKISGRCAVLPIGGRNIDPRRHAAVVAADAGRLPRCPLSHAA
jgi:threonine dehydratase